MKGPALHFSPSLRLPYRVFVALSGLLLLSRCIESIDPVLGSGMQFLVIEGQITDDGATPYVRVMQSGDLNKDIRGTPIPVLDAEVSIIDDVGNEYCSDQTENGVYSFSGLIGQVGRSYQSSVTYSERSYTSSWEELLPVNGIDEIKAISRPIDDLSADGNIVTRYVYDVMVTTDIPTEKKNTYFKWNISGIYQFTDVSFPFPFVCYVSNDLNKNNVSVFGDPESSGQILEDHVIYNNYVNYHFGWDYCFVIEQRSITADAYRFWNQTQRILEREGGLFEDPPSLIQGNFLNAEDSSEPVFGFFSASSVHHDFLCLGAFTLQGVQELECYRNDFNQPALDPTCYCSEIPNATLDRPYYFDSL